MTTTRNIYGLLDWAADLGGLFRAVLAFGYVVTAPFSLFAFNQYLLKSLFWKKEKSKETGLKRANQIKSNFGERKKI